MLTHYPALKPNKRYCLEVEQPHRLYVEESGVEDGIPVVVIHSGPGGCSESFHRRFFDPEEYRIILYDQRGCGKSTPHASVENNNTKALVEDLEAIRKYLNIDKWVVFGGGWGTFLGLLYAEAHPERVHGLILWGTFLGRGKEIDWYYGYGTNRIFPDYWAEFVEPIPAEERDNIIEAYHKRLFGPDDLVRRVLSKSWSTYEGLSTTLEPQQQRVKHYIDPPLANALARIGSHFLLNRLFIEENQVLRNIHKIAHIPGCIIHGRYDMVCLMENAWELHKSWANSELKVIRDAGHSVSEEAIIDALVHSTGEMLKSLKM